MVTKGRNLKLKKADDLVKEGTDEKKEVSTKSSEPPKEPEKPKSPAEPKQQPPPQPAPTVSPQSVTLKVVREDPPSLEHLPFQPSTTSVKPEPLEPTPTSEDGKTPETPPTPEPIPTPTQEYSTPPPYQPPTGEEPKAGEPTMGGGAQIPPEVSKMTGKQTAQWFVDTYSLWVPEIADDYSKFDLEEIKNWVFNQKLPPETFSMAEQANIDSKQSLQVPEVLQKWMVDSITPLCELRGFSASPEFIAGFAVVMVSFIIGKQAIKKHKIHEQFLREGIEIMRAKHAPNPPPKQEEKKDDKKKAA